MFSEETRRKLREAISGEKNHNFGGHLSEATRKKISESLIGVPKTEEHKQKNREAQLGEKGFWYGKTGPNFGKTPSEETRQKQREAKIGVPLSEEHRRNLSKAKNGENHPNFGKTTPKETRRKISQSLSGENSPNFGGTFSDETCRKISETLKEGYRIGRIKLSPLIGRGKAGYYEDLGHYLRSMWEANLARVLKSKRIDYQYEQVFDLRPHFPDSYRPDFYLPALDLYIEVKGWMYEEGRMKINVFEENHNLQVIDKKKYHELEKLFTDKIENWDLRPQEHQKQVDLDA